MSSAQTIFAPTVSAPAAKRAFRDGQALPEMVVVPPGQFWMGATDGDDKFASIVEKPRHTVEIGHSIAIGRYPVTFDEWDAYVRGAPAAHRPADHGWGRGRLPVCNVSWDDARNYVKWLSEASGRGYRLPSEAEWEYCCRGGAGGVFATGAGISVRQANFLHLDFGDRPGVGRPVAVGFYPANGFGLYDMHGNVCELVADVWHDTYAGAPADGSAWEAPARSAWRVVRGGGWDALPRILRCAFRDWVRRDQRLDNMGFRVACDLS
jgi:formylglycine-generating enzyme required for sulfatase activity